MSSKQMLWIAIAAAIVLTGCGPTETETETETELAPAEPAPAASEPDPTVVDAGHYTAEFENDRVRIVRIAYGAGEESVMHYHPEAVGIYLTEAHVQMTMPDGETMTADNPAGGHGFYPAGRHLPKNVGEEPLELVLVELKGEAIGADPEGDDPTEVDSDHYTLEFENEKVRILRIAYGAGEESVMHYHPDTVAVFLTDHLVQMTTPDGETSEVTAKAGEQLFIPAGQHLPKNITDGPWELVLVELK